ncbi:hypothetical protein GF312_02905 [Candidatus Poribacteria bacterium]|nr:hypothetical protein [Candidatus Poribacteria bacterium]
MENQTPKRKILILSDDKPGHFNQSMGIVDRMNDVHIKTIQIKFKSKTRDNLLRVMVWLINKLPEHTIKSTLRWALDESSFHDVLNINTFDVVLSTGSSVAAPNLLISKLTGAKSVVCTRPSPVGIRPFNLAILPEHSRSRHMTKNIVMTIGVPNRVTPDKIKSAGDKFGEIENKVIGLLLGGDDPYYYISPEFASSLCEILSSICQLNDYRLVLTTSRRTNLQSEKTVALNIKDSPICLLCILASEPRDENPVPGMLGISDVVVVTEDSFSMVCEAASSGKKVIILEVDRKRKAHTRRQRVYDLLVKEGYARYADLSSLESVIMETINDNTQPKVLDDARTAADALRKIID